MAKTKNLRDKTIEDFGSQWAKYTENEGWYGSLELFEDIIMPLLKVESLKDAYVAEIGSGSGRIVGMLLQADVKHIDAIEPARGAFDALEQNLNNMEKRDRVNTINSGGESWSSKYPLDYVFSVGVLHHIPDPVPAVKAAFKALKPGGHFFIWLYGYEGNEVYLHIFEPIRIVTTRLPHFALRAVVEIMYFLLVVYRYISKVVPLPLRSYIENVLWPLSPMDRRIVIYDKLNPAHTKYYKKSEAIELLEKNGFKSVKAHHRHGYSWSVIGQKPAETQ